MALVAERGAIRGTTALSTPRDAADAAIEGLVKRYRTGDLALKSVDLEVPDGQVMALIGPSGAGK